LKLLRADVLRWLDRIFRRIDDRWTYESKKNDRAEESIDLCFVFAQTQRFLHVQKNLSYLPVAVSTTALMIGMEHKRERSDEGERNETERELR
jgi:hypothetical protein